MKLVSSLWHQSQLLAQGGLYKVVDAFLYRQQVQVFRLLICKIWVCQMATCEECEKEDHINCANAWTFCSLMIISATEQIEIVLV